MNIDYNKFDTNIDNYNYAILEGKDHLAEHP